MKPIPIRVPTAVLTDFAQHHLHNETARAGGFWFTVADTPADQMRCRVTGAVALSVAARPEFTWRGTHLGVEAAGFQTGKNGGFKRAGALAAPQAWTAAIIWAGGDQAARSLLALRGPGSDNYVFLAESDDQGLILRDDSNRVTITGPRMASGWQMTVMSCRDDRLRLSPAAGEVAEAGGLTGLTGSQDLLIGCRSHRPGMPKTLGAGFVSDVMLWPGLDLLAPQPDDPALAAALDEFRLWRF